MQSTSTSTPEPERPFANSQVLGDGQHADKMQSHWVLARAGKRVLRPGGLELTRQMLGALAIGPEDRVVEFAPGLGVTARIALQYHPLTYSAVERDHAAAAYVRQRLARTCADIVLAPAEQSGLPSSSASVVYSEALLTMKTQPEKSRLIAEARRLLLPGGRYGIHEICLLPDDISDRVRCEIQAAMSKEIHVGVQPLSRSEWVRLFEQNQLKVTWSSEVPMHLLEPWRVLQDEGFVGSLRFAFKIATSRMLRRRIFAMRQLFRKYQEHLGAIALVGQRSS